MLKKLGAVTVLCFFHQQIYTFPLLYWMDGMGENLEKIEVTTALWERTWTLRMIFLLHENVIRFCRPKYQFCRPGMTNWSV